MPSLTIWPSERHEAIRTMFRTIGNTMLYAFYRFNWVPSSPGGIRGWTDGFLTAGYLISPRVLRISLVRSKSNPLFRLPSRSAHCGRRQSASYFHAKLSDPHHKAFGVLLTQAERDSVRVGGVAHRHPTEFA
jgi:hypothetical protein